MRLKPDGQDLGLDLRKRGGGVATPLENANASLCEVVIYD